MIILNNTDYKVNPMRNSILFVLAVASLEAGCGAKLPSMKPFKMEVQQGNVVTSKMLLQLRPGMTRSQVRYIMGTPLIVDSFRDNRWDYFYELRKQGVIVEKRRVILDFDKDSLVSVRGDVVPSADNPEIKTIVETPQKKEAPENDVAWTDKLKFWKGDDAAANVAAPVAVPPAATPEVKPAMPANAESTTPAKTASTPAQAEEVVPYIPEGEYAASTTPSEKAMAAQVVDAVEPSPVASAPVAAAAAVVAPEARPAASAATASQKGVAAAAAATGITKPDAAKKPSAKVLTPSASKSAVVKPAQPAEVVMEEDGEVIPYIPEGEYVAPVVPTEQEMVKGNMAEANQPATDAQAHQVTEKGVAPAADSAAEPPPTFVAEQLPEPEPEPALPPPPPAAKSIVKPVPAATETIKPVVQQAPTAVVSERVPSAAVSDKAEAAPGEDGIKQAVANWAQAWRSKDVKTYLAAYAPDFVPEAPLSRKAWEAQRKQRLAAGQGAITLILNNIQVQRDGAAATVQFEQKYAAKAFKDSLNKTLDMRYEPAQKRWLITREYVEAAAAAASVADAPAAIAAEPAAMTAGSASTEAAVDKAIQTWAQAWRSKNAAGYFAAYAQTFVPDGLPSRAAWEAQRKKRLSPQQGKISLEIEGLAISRDGDVAIATFTQKYAAKSYSDQMVKRLELKQDATSQRWLIVRETAASGAGIPAARQQVTAPEGSAEHLDGVLEQIGF